LFAIVINFYFTSIVNPINLFRDTLGLFNDTKYVYVIMCIFNIAFSIIFGKKWAIFGILIATTFSKLLTSLWFDPKILYKKVFKKSVLSFYLKQILQIVIVVILYILLLKIMNIFNIRLTYLNFILKSLVCLVTTLSTLILLFCKTNEHKYLKNRIINTIINKKGTLINEKV